MLLDKYALATPIVPSPLGLVLTFVVSTVHRSMTEGRQARWIESAFQIDLSPESVDILVRKAELLFSGGTEWEPTIRFSNLRGFTSGSEGLPPARLVNLLNEYLDGMAKIILRAGGTLEKYCAVREGLSPVLRTAQ